VVFSEARVEVADTAERLPPERPAVDGVDLDGCVGVFLAGPGDAAERAIHRACDSTFDSRLPFRNEHAANVPRARILGRLGKPAKVVLRVVRLAVQPND